MKKLILSLSVAVLGLVSAKAQPVEITITGATAFRANAYDAVRGLLNPGFAQNPAHPASGASKVTWTGTMPAFGARPVTIRASYSGSAAGVQSLTANSTVNFLLNSTAGDTATTNQVADFAFSDAFQTSTAFLTPVLSGTTVGVIPFVWVKNGAVQANIDNITAQTARGIFNLGYFPAFQFTGNIADTDIVNVIGRDSGSGTRTVTLSEIGLGASATVVQRKVSAGNYIDDAVGYNSNGLVANDVNDNVATSAEGAGGAISYLGLNDATTAITSVPAGAFLKYNGVAYSADAVRNGQYTLWGYEHLYNRSPLAADETTFKSAIATRINTDLATSTTAIQVSTMNVNRLADGATVTP